MFKTSYKILSGVLLFIYMIWLSAININEIDYEPYMKKIWVIKDLKDDHFFYSNHYVLSFFITKIEEGVIEGEFGIGYIPWPTFYNRYFKSSSVTEERFKGKVFNNTANFSFNSEDGVKGDAILSFKENGEIEISVNFYTIDKHYEKIDNQSEEMSLRFPINKKYLLKPYNIKNIDSVKLSETKMYKTDLDSWGTVNVTIITIYTTRTFYPEVYLTNDNGDILYQIDGYYPSGVGIEDVIIEDINGDGLKDIKIISAPGEAEFTFYQLDNGLFYDSIICDNLSEHMK